MTGVGYAPEYVNEARLLVGEHGWSYEAASRALGVPSGTIRRWVLGTFRGDPGGERVPNERLREAFLASGLSVNAVARELGWWRKPSPGSEARGKLRNGRRVSRGRPRERVPDDTRVRAALGLKRTIGGNGYASVRQTLPVEVAEELCRAIGVDPFEVGL